jgi:hypothetical protein
LIVSHPVAYEVAILINQLSLNGYSAERSARAGQVERIPCYVAAWTFVKAPPVRPVTLYLDRPAAIESDRGKIVTTNL